jgi:hypothetical protein
MPGLARMFAEILMLESSHMTIVYFTQYLEILRCVQPRLLVINVSKISISTSHYHGLPGGAQSFSVQEQD